MGGQGSGLLMAVQSVTGVRSLGWFRCQFSVQRAGLPSHVGDSLRSSSDCSLGWMLTSTATHMHGLRFPQPASPVDVTAVPNDIALVQEGHPLERYYHLPAGAAVAGAALGGLSATP